MSNNMPKPTKTKQVKKKVRKVKAYADIGSHGYIFAFMNGNYPKMMHIYSEKVTPDLKPVTITYSITNKL